MLAKMATPDDDGAGPRGQRRLAAIAFADVAGYARLMAADEVGTHTRWMLLYGGLVQPATAEHRGRVAELRGDGVLAEFPSALDAVQWARAVQTHPAMTAAAAAEPGIRLRIAIHLGDVYAADTGIYGDAVNLAARLQEHAAPGGILLSETVHQALRGSLGAASSLGAARSLGHLQLKSFETPMRAWALEAPDAAAPPPAARPRSDVVLPSIAVLPLRSLDGDPDNYFAAGMVEDIVVSLARLRELFVVAHSSSLIYQGSRSDPQEVGRTLGVRYVLAGSVRRSPKLVRVTVQLFDAATGAALWSDRQEAAPEDIFELQDRITLRIVAGVTPQVRAAELRQMLRRRPDSFTAYDHLLRALHIINSPDPATSQRARDFLDLAMAEDANFARPVAWAAWWHCLRVGQGWSSDIGAESERALELAARAVTLDGDDAMALATYGHLLSFLRHEYDAALAAFDRAIEAAPSSAFACMMSSATLSYVGRCAEAIERAERAIRLSPFDQSRYLYYHRAALAHFACGDHAAALRWSRMCRAENPGYTANLRILAASLAALDADEEAREVADALLRLEPGFTVGSFGARRQPFQGTATTARYLDNLRRSGLPD